MTAVPAAFIAAIAETHRELADVPMTLHTEGWDSDAVEAGGFLFKFPKTATAADRLRREARYLALIRPRVPLPRSRSHHPRASAGLLASTA